MRVKTLRHILTSLYVGAFTNGLIHSPLMVTDWEIEHPLESPTVKKHLHNNVESAIREILIGQNDNGR